MSDHPVLRPFEPRLTDDDPIVERAPLRAGDPRADSLADGLDLPDDLAALAEQLGEDAGRLAALYPPSAAELDLHAPRRLRRPGRWLGYAAAVLIAGCGLYAAAQFASPLWPVAHNPHDAPRWAGRPEVNLAVAGSSLAAVAERHSHPTSAATAAVASNLESLDEDIRGRTLLPVLLFHGLTAPEQEGVLDLLEQESHDLGLFSL